MEDLIFCVNDIFGKFLSDNGATKYNIPEYQRGYKWTRENVLELLNDIAKFKYSDGQFYCLQHITLKKEGSHFNLIDGQQRLTTLYIILSYLGCGDLLKDKLSYSIRKDTGCLLEEIIRTQNFHSEDYEAQHKDGFYIGEVAASVQEWFSDKTPQFVSEIKDKILNHVNLIVNIPEGVSEEKIFKGLNGDRVPLDGSDLVRAILITRAAKEHFGNIDTPELTEFRIRMGMEIDNMNAWWGDREKQIFFQQLISNRATEDDTRVKFSNTMSISLLYRCFFDITSAPKEKFSFAYFEYGHDFNTIPGDDHWEMFDHLQSINSVLKEWFLNQEIYHWLGYLFFNFKGNDISTAIGNIKVTLNDIWRLWEHHASKDDFVSEIKRIICNLILQGYQDESSGESDEESFLNKISKISEDWFSNQTLLSRILILQDILYMMKIKGRLDVRDFSRNGYGEEDIEHIWCQNPQDVSLENKITITQWKEGLTDKKNGITDDAEIEGLKTDISDLEVIISSETLSNEEKARFKEIAEKYGAFSIGNLVLLSESINRHFKNAPYETKRNVIIQNYFGEGKKKHIRPWTLKVFIKGNSSEDSVFKPWSLKDIQTNANTIKESVSNFIKTTKQ